MVKYPLCLSFVSEEDSLVDINFFSVETKTRRRIIKEPDTNGYYERCCNYYVTCDSNNCS